MTPDPARLTVPLRDSLASRTAESLREGLARGMWRDHLPGERELALRLRVSRPTLRAALELLRRGGVVSVTHGKRRRIHQHPVGQRRTASRVIGLVSPIPLSEAPPVMVHWTDELRTRLAESDYQLDVLVSRAAYRPRPAAALEAMLHGRPLDAWILFRSPEPMQRWFVARQLPAVIAGSCWAGVGLPSVDVDYRAVCRHAAGRLLGRGHRRIHLLLPSDGSAGDGESEAGMQEAVAAHRRFRGYAGVLRHDGTPAGVVRAVDEALASGTAAFIVARSAHALTAVTHLQRRQLRFPGETAVVSRDDDSFLEHVVPSVTRYENQPGRYARELSRLVLSAARGEPVPPRTVRFLPRFRPGETG